MHNYASDGKTGIFQQYAADGAFICLLLLLEYLNTRNVNGGNKLEAICKSILFVLILNVHTDVVHLHLHQHQHNHFILPFVTIMQNS